MTVDYTRQTEYSDPRGQADLILALPADVAGIAEVIRNITVHYRGSGIDFPPERLAEIDSRWVDRMLVADQSRHPKPLAEPRSDADKIVGCCRDAALLTVSALRAKGIPARSRVGFADYCEPGFHVDHVITEYYDGGRWIATDTGQDVAEVPLAPGGLRTAAQVWTDYRNGKIDPSLYGVGTGTGIGGPWMIRNYVIYELAHRRGDELLLWDGWGDVSLELRGDLGLIDEIATLLLAADAGDLRAEAALARRYAEDPRLHPGDHITCFSPATDFQPTTIDLRRPREPATA